MKVAIVGSGVSGLVAAWLLRERHEVTVFEAADRIGGHVHTHRLEIDGETQHVDSGFIVFNEKNYVEFSRILAEIGVESRPTSMSFSVRHEESGVEYGAAEVGRLLAWKRNLLRPGFWRMLRDMVRFSRDARAALDEDPDLALGDWLERRGYSKSFVDWHLMPMAAALWSASTRTLRSFPVRSFVEFFDNHDMLALGRRPEWRTVTGGSLRYVEKLVAPFRDRIRISSPVSEIRRRSDGVALRVAGGEPEAFDQVVLALHADQALAILADPSAAEREVLGALRFQRNEVAVHTDVAVMPRRRTAWSSWNYHVPAEPEASATVTYHMNTLQGLDSRHDFLVTLNRDREIDPATVLARTTYHHPLRDAASVRAQGRLDEVSGVGRTHYCGAYWGHGFHEDGVRSALRVAAALGVER